MNRQTWLRLLVACVAVFGPMAVSAWACPFCGEANATDENRTKAFELSIVFMLSMPMLLAAGFGFGFYRLSRRAAQAALAASANEELATVGAQAIREPHPVP
jgi:hypothetical protein